MKLSTFLFMFLLFVSTITTAQDGKALFDTKCKSCHNIGGGKLVGPDLKGINAKHSQEWLINFTKNSTALIASGDKAAKAIFDEFGKMPMMAFDMPDADITAIFTHVKSLSSANTTEKKKNIIAPPPAPTGNAENGAKLFDGSVSFNTGGAACNACHSAGAFPGGTLAKDLTKSGAAVGAIMNSLPFPAMKAAYQDKKLSNTEIADLTAFLKKAAVDKEEPMPCLGFPIGGAILFILFMIAITIIWRKRKKETVNKAIYDRQK